MTWEPIWPPDYHNTRHLDQVFSCNRQQGELMMGCVVLHIGTFFLGTNPDWKGAALSWPALPVNWNEPSRHLGLTWISSPFVIRLYSITGEINSFYEFKFSPTRSNQTMRLKIVHIHQINNLPMLYQWTARLFHGWDRSVTTRIPNTIKILWNSCYGIRFGKAKFPLDAALCVTSVWNMARHCGVQHVSSHLKSVFHSQCLIKYWLAS